MKYLVIVLLLFAVLIGTRAKRAPSGKPKQADYVTQAEIATVARSTNEKVLLYFWKPNCPGCTTMGPIVDQVAAEFPDIPIIKINTADEKNRPVHDEYRIHSTPSFVILQNGKEVSRYERPFSDRKAYVSFLRPSKVY
ncbi:MAG: thioredoxin family protein [Nibricoccus sp.]